MTVDELVEQLQDHPGDMPVVFEYPAPYPVETADCLVSEYDPDADAVRVRVD